jgi:hypothetical protein
VPGLVAPLVAFALGAFFALQARAEIERFDNLERRAARRIAALFGALVVAPVTAYFVAFAGDWSLAYLAESQRVPSALGLVWVALTAAMAPLGFVAGERAVRRRARGELLALVAGPAAAVLVFVVALYPELRLEGTTAEVRGHFGTRPIAGSSLGWAILWMDALVAIGAALTLRALAPRRRRVDAEPSPHHLGPERVAVAIATSIDASSAAEAAPAPAAPAPERLLGQRRRRRAD